MSWPWPDELDALVAAPKHHELLFENDAVRVLETTIRAGDRTPMHTHRWPSVVMVLSRGDFVRRNADDQVDFDTRVLPPSGSPAQASWLAALPPHSLENVGTSDIRVISVEIKSPGV